MLFFLGVMRHNAGFCCGNGGSYARVANAFQDFGFVVTALGIAVSKRNIKGVENQLAQL